MNHTNEFDRNLHEPGRTYRTAREREEEIERSAAYTGRLIREADSDSRFELTEAASAILRQEALSGSADSAVAESKAQSPERRALSPLSVGIGLTVIGAALFLLLPYLGIGMIGIGLIAVLWGLIVSLR